MMEWTEAWEQFTDVVNRGMEGLNRGLLGLFGDSNARHVRRLEPIAVAVNEWEPRMQALSNEELKDQTRIFRERLAAGESLDELLVEAFAACRESGRRYLKMRHFDVQLMGGAVLHSGRIAEMVTGEGKTLVATLPAYLNALEGKGVHVVTVNDYLARRDAEWMSPLYKGLGLTVGAIQSNMDPHERQEYYACDITYGTNSEFGFDYLRDNMKPTAELQCQKNLRYAIIDEVDSILIDEARTPLIISGPAMDDPTKYDKANRVAMQLKRDVHFEVKEKEHTCHLTDEGVLQAERLVEVESFYTAGNMHWPHLIDNALKAHNLYKRDKDYMVADGQVIIIDEHTGRKMEGRQWSDGLHQAVEAKERVRIKEETQTLATITYQNFFKLYDKISGMTGTAMTEAQEFYKIYKLDVVAIPTNKPLRRVNHPDMIYCTEKEKWQAVVDEVRLTLKTGRPILVGTASVEKSELLSGIFNKHGIKHEVLNAKYVEREAEIVAQAGRHGAVTISTNMAGRGTDIILGGNPEAMAWAKLKNDYPTRLEVPPEVWREAVEPFEEPMRKEGREIAEPMPPLDLAKTVNPKRAEELLEIVQNASEKQLEDPQALADKHEYPNAKHITDLDRLLELANPGGLHIVGTERHESRRIDNQLRGRAGRQGDPGSSRFYLSLEDDLMRIFAGDWVRGILQRLGMRDGEAIESRLVSKRIEGAQKKVEERNFEVRKNLLEYDEIMDTQRKRVYGYRQDILAGVNCKELVLEMIESQIHDAIGVILAKEYPYQSFAAWASARLAVELDGHDFLRSDFDQAERIAKDEALRDAESIIIDSVDENLNEDAEPREWNWEGLANGINSRWELKISPSQLRRMKRDEIGGYVYQHVSKSIEKIHLEGGKSFFEPDFAIKSLVGWFNTKFNADLRLSDLPESESADHEEIAEFFSEQARKIYAHKEIEFPAQLGLARYLPETAPGQRAHYDREGLVHWIKSRFEVDVDLERYKTMQRHAIADDLMKLSADYLADGAVFDEVQAKIDEVFGSEEEISADRLTALSQWSKERLRHEMDLSTPLVERTPVTRELLAAAERRYRPEIREVERALLLEFLDTGWKDHLYAMDHLRSGIGLVGYAQIDPKVEYKRKGRAIFEEMWSGFEDKVTSMIFRAEEADTAFVSSIWHITNEVHEQAAAVADMNATNSGIRDQQDAAIEMSQNQGDQKTEPIRNRGQKVGRNAPCPCGSGKKYKQCCMKKAGGRMTA